MLTGLGTIHVNRARDRVVVELSRDFIPYYLWLFKKENWISLHNPMHGGHITLANKKLHPGADYRRADDMYHGYIATFKYDPSPIRGGRTKGFTMYYFRVFSDELDKIKRDLNVVDNSDYRGLHITLGNVDKNGSVAMPYWPEMIEIKK